MPLLEFRCTLCNKAFTKLFSFRESSTDGTPNGPANLDLTAGCPKCGHPSKRVEVSPVLPAMLYGDPAGYYKPSPTKRHSWKKVSAIEGNDSAV